MRGAGAAGVFQRRGMSPPSQRPRCAIVFAPKGLEVSSEVIVSRTVSAASWCFEGTQGSLWTRFATLHEEITAPRARSRFS